MSLPFVTLNVGDKFNSIQELRDKCATYALQNTFEFKLAKSDKTYYIIYCKVEGCNWRLYTASVKGSELYSIRTFNSEYNYFSINHYRHA